MVVEVIGPLGAAICQRGSAEVDSRGTLAAADGSLVGRQVVGGVKRIKG